MYHTPVLFRARSNREDFLDFVSLFDDDTGQAIDVSGRTLALPGDFTANAWTVISGNVVTASLSQITIKDYPFGNEMQAIALTVGLNLAIAAGAPVTIADALTGKNTLTGYVTSYAPATGAMVVQVGVAFNFEISGSAMISDYDTGYGSSSLIGDYSADQPLISAQLGNGLSVVDVGKIQVRIPAATMAVLNGKTYDVGMVSFDGYDSRQIFVGKLPILRGRSRLLPLASSSPSNAYGLP